MGNNRYPSVGGPNPMSFGQFGGLYGGFPLSPMMGGYGSPMLMGPFQIIHSVNYFFANATQMAHMLGANSYVLVQLFCTAKEALKDMELLIRRSAFRRWLQRKSKKSAVLRYVFVFASMAIATQLVRIVRYLIESKLGIQSSVPRLLESGSSVPTASLGSDRVVESLNVSSSLIQGNGNGNGSSS
jgi:hypothetical protein